MNELFIFISRSRAFIIFAFLEIFSLWCVYRFNNYGSAVLFNTTSELVAKSEKVQSSVIRYTKLNQINEDLANENLRLNTALIKMQNLTFSGSDAPMIDSAMANRFTLIKAETHNLSTNLRNNYITINKGTKDGVAIGMGVISATGVVGKVKMCSPNYSIVTSILHSENLVSTKHKKSGKFGSVKWDGTNPKEADMLYMDMYEQIQKGDTVVTSDLNSVFPGNILVGTVKKVVLKKGQQFWNITLDLTTDFKNLAFVYVIKNTLIEEQTQLEATISNTKNDK